MTEFHNKNNPNSNHMKNKPIPNGTQVELLDEVNYADGIKIEKGLVGYVMSSSEQHSRVNSYYVKFWQIPFMQFRVYESDIKVIEN